MKIATNNHKIGMQQYIKRSQSSREGRRWEMDEMKNGMEMALNK